MSLRARLYRVLGYAPMAAGSELVARAATKTTQVFRVEGYIGDESRIARELERLARERSTTN